MVNKKQYLGIQRSFRVQVLSFSAILSTDAKSSTVLTLTLLHK